LKNFEEAYTSDNWIVRIYKVLPRKNRAQKFENLISRTIGEKMEP
jgi:hypothetical protein